MNPSQLARLETLRDRLIERAITDADPQNWSGGDKLPKDMTPAERGNANWDRRVARETVSLTMQIMRMVANPQTGGATVPDKGEPFDVPEEETVEANVSRYEQAAAQVLAGRVVKTARDGSKPKR